MGAVLDTTVFVDLERRRRRGDGDHARLISRSLEYHLGDDEEVGIAAITASELLHGVHRATSAHRARREAYVEAVISMFPILPFDLLAARAHARIWADLATAGIDVGAHDRLVAATATSIGWRVATANIRHFDRIAGLDVVEVRPIS